MVFDTEEVLNQCKLLSAVFILTLTLLVVWAENPIPPSVFNPKSGCSVKILVPLQSRTQIILTFGYQYPDFAS